jgi:hypothetical protein
MTSEIRARHSIRYDKRMKELNSVIATITLAPQKMN